MRLAICDLNWNVPLHLEPDNEVSTDYMEALETENQALRLVVMSGLGFAIPETIEGVEANISAIQQVLNAHTE